MLARVLDSVQQILRGRWPLPGEVCTYHRLRLRAPLLCPLEYINAPGFKLCRYSVPCNKSVDLLQILLPGGSDG